MSNETLRDVYLRLYGSDAGWLDIWLDMAAPAPSVPDDVAKDAARYRRLRKLLSDRSSNGKSHWFCCITEGVPEKLDEAIDDDLAAAPEP